ncbi:hypothetical protein UFOVP184_51 [uncultured Caudovirales phage]|uniref:Uncharacterized protein n=1 Tax=uncultured Caudovirales phage TaxID=2100421 RepID=A0A6J7WDQ3_9CAUD|nr:hypothetical protein UFOVP184_51 [uncultured Caudovirales phage]
MLRPYVTYEDVLAICPYVDQLQPGDEQFSGQRLASRLWLDAAITATSRLTCGFSVKVDYRVKRACAYKAASEILAAQITPMVEQNAYGTMAAKFARMAESEISTLTVYIITDMGELHAVHLGISKRGFHG